jgi:beta-galactosidase
VFPDTLTTRKNATAQAMEFGYFMHNVQIATVLRERAKTIRRADPLQRPVFAHKAAPEYASASDWTYARCQDFLGTSAYPAWGAAAGGWDDLFPATAGGRYDRHEALLGEIWHGVAVRFDAVRSANPQQAPVWAAEFQGGPVSTGLHKGRVPGAADLRRWMLTALASGVTGISFWVTRAEIMAPETNGFSLLDSTGNTTERFEEAARIGAALNRHPELFAQRTLEPAQVAIVVSEENYRLCGAMTDAAPHLAFSTLGWHRMLWEAGVPVAFVDARSVSGELAESVRLLVLPFPLSISEPLVKQLTDYVAAGGRVVSEACIGRLNEHAFANRGEISPAAADLFGARHRRLVMVREPEDPPRWMPTERTWGEYAEYGLVAGAGVFHGAAVAPALYIQTFEPTSGETVFTWHGEPAGVLRGAACGPEDRPAAGAGGKGGALLLGTLAGHQGMAYRGPENRDLVARVLRWTGVQPHPACPAGRLLVRRRFAPEAEAWFFTNPHSGTITEEVDISGFRGVEDLLGGELPRNGNRVSLTVDELDVRVLVLRR